MQAPTALKILALNHNFYSNFGISFSATRQRLQPGVRKIILTFTGEEHILDLGCGNGEFARCLAQSEFHGTYTGLDFSPPLLSDAKDQPAGFPAVFSEADLTTTDWDSAFVPGQLSLITAFAVLHHVPSMDFRRIMIDKVQRLLATGGKFILSNWQFLNSEKLKTHIQPWSAAGIDDQEVDEGDYLLDWRAGGKGLRYAHHFSAQELTQLANETLFDVKESFLSDGDGGRLGLYQVWERRADEHAG
jgi:SAM-dependent methyltransferase